MANNIFESLTNELSDLDTKQKDIELRIQNTIQTANKLKSINPEIINIIEEIRQVNLHNMDSYINLALKISLQIQKIAFQSKIEDVINE